MSARWGATPDEWFEFGTLLDLGADLLPVVSNLRAQISPKSSLKKVGKVPSRYGRNKLVIGVPNWTGHVATLNELVAWEEQPDYGISVICRVAKPVDIDVPDVEKAVKIQGYVSEWLYSVGVTEAPLRYRVDSGKRIMLLRVNANTPKTVITVDGGIVEFLGNKQQFIAAGTHENGARYEWQGLDRGVPELTLDQYNRLISHVQETFGIEPIRKEKERKIIDGLIDEPIYNKLVERNAILSHEDNGSFGIICPFHDEHTTESGDTGTVYFPAHTGGMATAAIKCLHGHCAHRQTHDFAAGLGITGADDFEVLPEDGSDFVQPGANEPHPGVEGGFNFILGTAFMNSGSNTEWVIKGLIPCDSVGLVIGPPGSGKTFVLIDAVFAAIRNVPWRDRRTKKAKVLYICAEGENSFRLRLRAYCKEHGIEDIDDLAVLAAAPNFSDKKEVKKFIRDVRAFGISFDLIVVDTLSQCAPGADENAAKDMGELLANYKHIQRALNAAIVLVHHTGKNASAGARGWSGIKANTGYVIEVNVKGKGADTQRWVEVSRQKDGEEGAIFEFQLREVVVGVDQDGDDLKSMVVDFVEDGGLDVLPEAEGAKGIGPLKKDILSKAVEFKQGNARWPVKSELTTMVRENTTRQQSKVHEAIDEMVERGLLDERDKALSVPGTNPRSANLEE